MSLFQCDKCGCVENTALTECSHSSYLLNQMFDSPGTTPRTKQALKSYKDILGIKYKTLFGMYCSACCPVWFVDDSHYGEGKNPNPKPGEGLWHGEFDRHFLPKGQFETDPQGNLWHKETHDTDIKKYFLTKEEGT